MKVLLKYIMLLAMTLLVLLAMVISLARYFMPSLDQYEQQITDLIAKELQLDVQFGTFAGDWYRLGPAIKITDIVLSTHEGKIITEIDALYLSFNLLSSITQQKLVPAYLNVIGLQLDLEQNADKSLAIVNLPKSTTPSSNPHFLADILKKYSSITVRRSQINFTDLNGKSTPVYLRRMVLSRAGQSHQLDVMLNLLNHPTRLELVSKITGDLAKTQELAITGYFKVDNAVLDSYLKSYPIKGYALQGGLVDMDAWIEWRQGALQSLQAEVNLQQLQMHNVQSDKNLKPFDVQGAFLWKQEEDQTWTLSSQDLYLGIDDLELMPLTNQFKFANTTKGYEFVSDKVLLGNVTKALLWSEELPEDKHSLLTELSPHGELNDVKINWHDHNWQLGLGFDALSFQSQNALPGAENLSGELMANNTAGKISLDSAQTRIDYTSLFPYPIIFSEMTGNITWQNNDNLWQVESTNISLVNDEVDIDADFKVNGGQNLDTYLEANVDVPQLNSLNLYHYLPVGELSDDLADWLKTSMGEGQLSQLSIKTFGPVKDFPYYDNGDGQFRLQMNIEDLDLTFDSEWPKLEKVNGQLLFFGRDISIEIEKAQIYQTDLLNLSADIHLPSDATSWLNIHGEIITPAQRIVDFIKVTPLDQTLTSNLEPFTFNLPITMTLDINLPLDSETDEDPIIKGMVQMSEGDAILNEYQLTFSDLEGVFAFSDNGLMSDGINTRVFGKPAVLTIHPQVRGSNSFTHWELRGSAKTSDIATHFPSAIWDYVNGESEFVVSFDTVNDANVVGFDLSVASDLKGTQISLPQPLTKAKNDATPVIFTTSIGKPNTQVRLQYAKLIDGFLEYAPQGETSVLTGGRVQLGGALTNFEIPKGIVIAGHLNDFSYDTWQTFVDNLKTTPSENNFSQHIKQVDVNIDRFLAFHYPFTKAKLHLTQAQNQWLLNMNAQELIGRLTIPQQENGILKLDFDYCNWNNTQHTEEKNPIDPRSIPALTFNCKDFVYDQKKLGTITFALAHEPLGVKINGFKMSRVNDTLTASGRWIVENNKQNTHFAGHLKSAALDKTLELVDIKSTILGSKTDVDFSLHWPGDPFEFALAHLSGDLNIHLSKGVLVDVNPGFGRILSLLSIQSLQRRLRLDFSDVFKKGFSFDDITAVVTIKNGIAHSDNLMMEAPAAELKMKGDVNLGTKQLNLLANLTTHITSSLPIAATIASGGNPIVGAIGVGVWAADKIVKSQAGDMLGSTYKVTGTWEKPIVNGK